MGGAAVTVPRSTRHGGDLGSCSPPATERQSILASRLVAMNVHPRLAMAILHHSQIAVTTDIYSHVSSESTRRPPAPRRRHARAGRRVMLVAAGSCAGVTTEVFPEWGRA